MGNCGTLAGERLVRANTAVTLECGNTDGVIGECVGNSRLVVEAVVELITREKGEIRLEKKAPGSHRRP